MLRDNYVHAICSATSEHVIITITCHYYYYYDDFGVRCARPGESKDTLSAQRPQPHTTNPWKEEKDKTVGDKK